MSHDAWQLFSKVGRDVANEVELTSYLTCTQAVNKGWRQGTVLRLSKNCAQVGADQSKVPGAQEECNSAGRRTRTGIDCGLRDGWSKEEWSGTGAWETRHRCVRCSVAKVRVIPPGTGRALRSHADANANAKRVCVRVCARARARG